MILLNNIKVWNLTDYKQRPTDIFNDFGIEVNYDLQIESDLKSPKWTSKIRRIKIIQLSLYYYLGSIIYLRRRHYNFNK